MEALQLELGRRARLMRGREELPLRRKSLALLAYLALEGPKTRAQLAALLWRPNSGLQNLRVELSALRRVLGLGDWARASATIALPEPIAVKKSGELILENLDYLSSHWDAWLADLRQPGTPAESAFERGLLILEAFPGDDVEGHLERLRARCQGRLQLLENGQVPAFTRQKGLFVFVRSAFGEDPSTLLRLRAAFPPEHTRYQAIPPVPFAELETRLGFDAAARLWLASAGRGAHVEEALRAGLPHPIKLRTQYALEARHLPQTARRALEILALHPGPVPEAAIEDWLGEEIESLLTRRWLKHTRRGWRFRDPVARRALVAAADESLRLRRHRELATRLAEIQPLGAAYHDLKRGQVPHWPEMELAPWARALLDELRGRPEKPAPKATPEHAPGRERLLPEPRPFGPGAEQSGHSLYLLRDHADVPAGFAFEPQDEPTLWQVRVEHRVENPLGVGVFGDALPLAVETGEAALVFAPTKKPNPVVQTLGAFWLYLPEDTPLFFRTRAEAAVFRIDVRVFAARPGKQVAPLSWAAQPSSRTLPESGHRL